MGTGHVPQKGQGKINGMFLSRSFVKRSSKQAPGVFPGVFVVLCLFWISTAFVSLGPGWDYGIGLMREGGVEGTYASLTVVAGALADLAIGIAIGLRPTSRYGLYAAIGISFTYAIIGTVLVPRLWADPLGPMLKIWPIIILHFVALGILDDR